MFSPVGIHRGIGRDWSSLDVKMNLRNSTKKNDEKHQETALLTCCITISFLQCKGGKGARYLVVFAVWQMREYNSGSKGFSFLSGHKPHILDCYGNTYNDRYGG